MSRKNILLVLGGVVLLIFIVFFVKEIKNNFLSVTGDAGVHLLATNQSSGIKSVGFDLRTVDSEESQPMVAPAGTVNPNPDKEQNPLKRLIIKTGNISILVKDVKEGVKKIEEYTDQNKGYVVSSNIYEFGLAPYAEIKIRIPVDIFDSGMSSIKQIGEVKSESSNGDDVTEKYIDLESQLKNLKAVEAQFLSILTKAEKITDILAVQNELKQIRGEIEVLQGRMKYLEKSSSMSTVSINLSTDPDYLPTVDSKDKWKPWAVVKQAARDLLSVAKVLVDFFIWLTVFIPLWAVLFVLVLIIRKIWKKMFKNKK